MENPDNVTTAITEESALVEYICTHIYTYTYFMRIFIILFLTARLFLALLKFN